MASIEDQCKPDPMSQEEKWEIENLLAETEFEKEDDEEETVDSGNKINFVEATAEEEIVEIPVPKKVYEVIDVEDEEDLPPSPLDCPICNSSFSSSSLLHHHLSLQHFHRRLVSLVTPRNSQFWCPDSGCSFSHRFRRIVVQHIANNHSLAFTFLPLSKSPSSEQETGSGTKRCSDGFVENEPKRLCLPSQTQFGKTDDFTQKLVAVVAPQPIIQMKRKTSQTSPDSQLKKPNNEFLTHLLKHLQ